jgi:hypothetical protein
LSASTAALRVRPRPAVWRNLLDRMGAIDEVPSERFDVSAIYVGGRELRVAVYRAGAASWPMCVTASRSDVADA